MTSQADARLLRNATWRLAALTAAAVTVILVLVGGLALGVVIREQGAEARRTLDQAITDLDDLSREPATVGVWVQDPNGSVRRSKEAPDWLPLAAPLAAVSAQHPRDERVVDHNGKSFRLLTLSSHGTLAQAVESRHGELAERSRVLTGLVVAELAGLALSALLGGFLARRAIGPLAVALQRQRRFVADASHELRTPLTLLSTRAQLLERSLRRHAPADVHSESVALVSDTRRLGEVVDDLLLSASLATHPARREAVDVVDVARSAVAAAVPYAREQGVALCGPADDEAPLTVLGATGPLRRVLDALIDNALTHGREQGHVDVQVYGGAQVTARVVDDGPGIHPDVATRLFDRFAHSSGDGSRRHFGLGLALVREIVEAHAGTISADATPGGGATFTVTLPGA
ncbi:MAG: hypothetical protein QOJ60_904 [Actinomycetota bacterium]|nr:hypothetical protein [Actinomycetota bacterium]